MIEKKICLTFHLFKEFFSFFKRSILGGVFQSNHHILVDGHGLHVSLEAIEQTQYFRLDVCTLTSHIFHAMQSFDVSCLNFFITTFKRKIYTLLGNAS